jgi:membrane protease YdiL (CAAX protease family)
MMDVAMGAVLGMGLTPAGMLPSPVVSDEPAPPAASPAPAPPPPRRPVTLGTGGIVRLALGFYAIVTLFAVGYAFFDRIVRKDDGPGAEAFLGLALPSLGHLLAGLGLGLAIVGVTHVGIRALPAVRQAAAMLTEVLGPLTWKQALIIGACSGVGEELLFRGALWPHLGLLGTTFLFGLVHVLPKKKLWGYPLFALGAGLLLGLLRDASGSVFPPILAHFTVNALNLGWLGAKHDALRAADA